MKRLCVFFITILMIATAFIGSGFAQNNVGKWEPVKEIETNLRLVSKQPNIEVFSQPSRITVTVHTPINVKIFTILGKLVSTQDLEPGIYEYKLNTHGIYIIKTSETTCKVAI